MSFAFGKTVFESSLPDLTIGVKDGNLMYTHPEQLLNRKRCRCYMTSSKGYKAYLINYLRYKLHLIVPPTSRRIATRARIINARIKTKLDAFFIGSTSQLAHAQDLNVTPGRTYVGNETLAIRATMNKYIRDNEYTKDRIRVWTFGEPRVGNRRFAEYYTEVLGNQTYRVTNQADIVPHLPPWQILGYQHHPLELHILNKEGDIYVCHKTVREDLGGAYRWPTIDTGVADHVDYFGKPDITLFSPLIEW
ncbi:hypothetical protein GGI04_001626 [Coemansia thaxteri]|nr:hypothetical protein GGI04_001626 [Coemansia thaxteri]KAJ2484579.1 hypothetical protein EV174_002328 [Coemansia sp. RSA 2320]